MKLDHVRPLAENPGPWASVYLDASHDDQSRGHQVDLRWQALKASLAEQGCDQEIILAVENALHDQPQQPGRYGLAIFARAGEPPVVETLSAPPPADEATFGVLAHLMPLLAMRDEEIPYVRVVADRTGADVDAVSAGGVPRHRRVTGSERFPMTKVHAGGWRNLRYQEAVEETWKRNAGDVVAAAAGLADRVDAEVIVVGGDVRAVEDFIRQLPKRWQSHVVKADTGSRQSGPDDSALAEAIASVASQHAQDAVDRYRAQLADGTAASGLSEVAAHLQGGQVDTVLLVNHPASTDTLWIDPADPAGVSTSDAPLREAGVSSPVKVRADDALVRAIAGTGADLILLGPGEAPMKHDIGAVMRYAIA